MRNEMIGAVVRRAMEHPEFRKNLVENPHDALARHGFALEQEEMSELEKIRGRISGEGDDVERELQSLARDYGVRIEN